MFSKNFQESGEISVRKKTKPIKSTLDACDFWALVILSRLCTPRWAREHFQKSLCPIHKMQVKYHIFGRREDCISALE